MFKKITYKVIVSTNMIEGREAKDVSNEDAITILKDPRVIEYKATRMTMKEAFKGLQGVNL